jgi:hypothetical protein
MARSGIEEAWWNLVFRFGDSTPAGRAAIPALLDFRETQPAVGAGIPVFWACLEKMDTNSGGFDV